MGAFAVGSTLAGAAAGALSGAAGLVAAAVASFHERFPIAVLAVALAVGLLLDLRAGGLRLPTVRRQVNEDWLGAYRGWVYGLAFGAQLGVGVATIVSASAVYLTFLACLLTASPLAGAAIGGGFGLVRALTLLASARVRDPAALIALGRALRRWEGPARAGGLAVQGALLALATAALVV